MAITHDELNDNESSRNNNNGAPEIPADFPAEFPPGFSPIREVGDRRFLAQLPDSVQEDVFKPEVAPAFEPNMRIDLDQQVLGNLVYQRGVISIERFFSSYIDRLSTLIDQAFEAEKQISEVVTGRSVILARDLREMVLAQWMSYFKSLLMPKDPFFPAQELPRITPMVDGDFVTKHPIPLSEYLQRYAAHYGCLVDPVLASIDSGILRVGISDIKRDMHYLILPKHADFLDAVLNNKLCNSEQ